MLGKVEFIFSRHVWTLYVFVRAYTLGSVSAPTVTMVHNNMIVLLYCLQIPIA